MELRPYQQEAREAVQKEWLEGRKRTLLVLPTGTGKTVVFSKIIEDQVREGKRTDPSYWIKQATSSRPRRDSVQP